MEDNKIKTEQDTQNLFIANQDITPLMFYVRGILAEDDEYRMRNLKH